MVVDEFVEIAAESVETGPRKRKNGLGGLKGFPGFQNIPEPLGVDAELHPGDAVGERSTEQL